MKKNELYNVLEIYDLVVAGTQYIAKRAEMIRLRSDILDSFNKDVEKIIINASREQKISALTTEKIKTLNKLKQSIGSLEYKSSNDEITIQDIEKNSYETLIDKIIMSQFNC